MSEKHHHHHGDGISKSDELKALLDYLVKHNESHTNELAALAEQLNTEEHSEAYRAVLAAMEEYTKGNALLGKALELLKQVN